MTEEPTTPTPEQVKADIAVCANKMIENDARAAVLRALLEERRTALQEVIEGTILYKEIQDLEEWVKAYENDRDTMEGTAKGLTTFAFQLDEDKHPHSLFSIQIATTTRYTDEDGLYEYALERAPDLMVTRPAHKGRFNAWVKAQIAADRTILEYVETRATPRPVVARKAVKARSQAKQAEIQAEMLKEAGARARDILLDGLAGDSELRNALRVYAESALDSKMMTRLQ